MFSHTPFFYVNYMGWIARDGLAMPLNDISVHLITIFSAGTSDTQIRDMSSSHGPSEQLFFEIFLAPITAAVPQGFKTFHAQEKPITEAKIDATLQTSRYKANSCQENSHRT